MFDGTIFQHKIPSVCLRRKTFSKNEMLILLWFTSDSVSIQRYLSVPVKVCSFLFFSSLLLGAKRHKSNDSCRQTPCQQVCMSHDLRSIIHKRWQDHISIWTVLHNVTSTGTKVLKVQSRKTGHVIKHGRPQFGISWSAENLRRAYALEVAQGRVCKDS